MDNAEASRNPSAARAAGEGADGQLLERFVDQRDEAAFAALVKRFGPLVLGVCRRVLRHEQDAEDAFQATFLVLVRNARSIQQRESVGSWLYGVACRIARRVKGGRARRPVEELTPRNVAAPESRPDWLVRDLRPVLDEEIDRLPPKYRVPFVLCHVEGQTNEQAARQLGCPVGTVLSRLARARGRLRARLGRRGLALPAALLAATLTEALACAAVSSSMVRTIAKAAALQAGGKTAGKGAFSPKANALANAISKSRWKLKLASALGVVFILVLIALYFLLPGKGTNVPPDVSAKVVVPKVKPVKIDDKEKLQGIWRAEKVEMGGKEMPGAKDFRAVFAGDKVNVHVRDAKGPNWTFVLDQTKQPKTITLRTDKGETQPGIYEFEGDKLKLLMNPKGDTRPTSFSAQPAESMILLVFQREPAAGPKSK
jgi:RNA polymerase sigma factor (sigma-70 family)